MAGTSRSILAATSRELLLLLLLSDLEGDDLEILLGDDLEILLGDDLEVLLEDDLEVLLGDDREDSLFSSVRKRERPRWRASVVASKTMVMNRRAIIVTCIVVPEF